jgi:spermidine synthase
LQTAPEAPATEITDPSITTAALLLFASGLSALVFQLLWIKQLGLVVGIDVHAITIAVSAFFGGLALGGWVFGRFVDSVDRPLRLYSWIEFGVGCAGIGCTLALARAAPAFATLERSIGPLAWALPFLLVGTPATLMGGTLPVLLRALAARTGSIGSTGGRLYAANTAGAIAGALLTPFLLIPWLGVFGSSLCAGAINALAALVAFLLSLSASHGTVPDAAIEDETRPVGARLAILLYSVAGGIALGYEVVWSQMILVWTSTRSFAFAVVLAVYLGGLMLGSALYARRSDRTTDPWGLFGCLIAAAGVVALLQLFFLGNWLDGAQIRAATLTFNATGSESAAMAARFVLAACCVVLLPTILLGAAFPAALRLTASGAHAGRDAGRTLAVNTIGGIIGTAITGFVLVPWLGLERSLAILALAASVVGGVAVVRGPNVRPATRWATLSCALVAVGVTVIVKPDQLAKQWAERRKGTLLFHEPGARGTVAVVEQGVGGNAFRRLYVQGVSNSGDSMTSLRYMRLQALLPLLIHRGEPRAALVIGLGTGITAGSLLAFDGLERRVCAELMPEVVRATSLFQGNHGVASDRRVELRLIDGRRELLRNEEKYDVITLEPPPPSAAGVVNLYSTDFYLLAARRLNPDGLVAQWLPLPTQNDDDTRSLVRSFIDVFPYATMWTTEFHEMLLIGSLTPIELDAERISERFQRPGVSASLREVGVDSPEAILATYICDQTGLKVYAADAPPVTDDRPRIEYGEWVVPGDFQRTFTNMMDLQTEPELINADGEFVSEVAEQRLVLHTFYASAFAASARDEETWKRQLASVLSHAPNNPYFRWFANGGAHAPTP